MAHVNETTTNSTPSKVHRIRELVAQERLLEARQLLSEALENEGDNPELRRFKVVLAPPEVAPLAFVDSDRSDELKWIANHGKDYRGEWVAVLGDELVAHAKTLKALRAALQNLPENGTPLVHRI